MAFWRETRSRWEMFLVLCALRLILFQYCEGVRFAMIERIVYRLFFDDHSIGYDPMP